MARKYKVSNGLSIFGLGLLGGLLLGWGARSRPVARAITSAKFAPEERHSPTRTATLGQESRQAEKTPALSTKSVPSQPDDLTPIEGIGPKINKVLQDAGITTFAQLAKTKVSQLEQILNEAGLRLAKADTWPEQAKLAAAGDWEELKRLQDQLDAGRQRD
jgi:large subunit ribosomal protein L21